MTMAYFTEQELTRYATEARPENFSNVKNARASTAVAIFLSHSHKDKILVKGLIAYFDKLGVEVYVDWNDSDMPRITNRETADRIKAKIHENKLFMVLATTNAINSKWVPWEVGIADQAKGSPHVSVIPVADRSGHYPGAEYLQLYRRIETTDKGGYGVFEPNATKGFILEYYLKNFGA